MAVLDITVQDVQDRYPDHTIIINNGHKDGVYGNFLLEEIPEYANRFICGISSIHERSVWIDVSVHSLFIPDFNFEEFEEA